ncbi:hypothetical protein J6590_038747 [Homalodisca vitripennis]|nr:hypothetical protein J6590_038747 [Homalodisca vitripennis]
MCVFDTLHPALCRDRLDHLPLLGHNVTLYAKAVGLGAMSQSLWTTKSCISVHISVSHVLRRTLTLRPSSPTAYFPDTAVSLISRSGRDHEETDVSRRDLMSVTKRR